MAKDEELEDHSSSGNRRDLSFHIKMICISKKQVFQHWDRIGIDHH